MSILIEQCNYKIFQVIWLKIILLKKVKDFFTYYKFCFIIKHVIFQAIKNLLIKYDRSGNVILFIRSSKKFVKKCFKQVYLIFAIVRIKRMHKNKCRELAKAKRKIQVVFIIRHASQWKYEEIYRLFEKNKNYNPKIIISPDFKSKTWLYDYKLCINRFENNNYSIVKYWDIQNNRLNSVNIKSFDLVFFQKTTDTKDPFYIGLFSNALTCYVPYSTYGDNNLESQYNKVFHNLLWKHYVATPIHLKMARSSSFNKGCNVSVVGYPSGDYFLKKIPLKKSFNIWKKTKTKKKKIIWAPHHTITESKIQTNHSNFLWLAKPMKEFAKKYQDSVQFAFKPHPNLRKELLRHEAWGEQRTDKYYRQWDEIENGQLEESNYFELFLESDAMIHDSVSFLAEYIYTKKPCCYIVKDVNKISTFLNEFGKEAFQLHQTARSLQDIESFIKSIINNSNVQQNFYKKEIFIKNVLNVIGSSLVSEKIFNDIEKNINFSN